MGAFSESTLRDLEEAHLYNLYTTQGQLSEKLGVKQLRIAGIEPSFASLNGSDPVAYILSANVARRNLTKGQRAMAVARLVKNSQQHAAEIVGVKK
jgi:hypothetical protein